MAPHGSATECSAVQFCTVLCIAVQCYVMYTYCNRIYGILMHVPNFARLTNLISPTTNLVSPKVGENWFILVEYEIRYIFHHKY